MTDDKKSELMKQAEQMPEGAKALVRQIKMMISNGQKLTTEEAMTLAMFGYREGLDPLNGECWILKKKSGEVIGCAVGIKGLRRKTTEALGTEDVWYPEFRDITLTYDPKDTEILYAYECVIRNTRATARWLTLQNSINRSDYTAEQIIEIFGHPPVWKGIGVVHKGEYVAANYPQQTRTKKRAEAAAINAMMGFGYNIMDDDTIIDVKAKEPTAEIEDQIDGEFTEDEPSVTLTKTEQVVNRLQENAEKKRLAEKKNGEWTQGRRGVLIGTIEKMCGEGDVAGKRHELIQKLFNQTSFGRLEWWELETLEDWVFINSDGTKVINPDAQSELDGIMAKLAERPGQADLFSGNTAG